MDAIAESVFDNTMPHAAVDDTPSHLSVILETSAAGWLAIPQTTLKQVSEALLVALNAHLASNTSNQVSVLASGVQRSEFLFPTPEDTHAKHHNGTSTLVSSKLYSLFRHVDEEVLHRLDAHIQTEGNGCDKGTLAGGTSMALAYIRRCQAETAALKARILIISITDDSAIPYIPVMNCIFAAQKMKTSIDVCQLGPASSFLQQAADATGGVYMDVKHPQGLIQYLTTAFFVDTSLRPFMVLPSQNNVDFRASCFVTGGVVERGYVCGVCLCILKDVPQRNFCPVCGSRFDDLVISKLRRGPVVTRKKKRKTDALQTPLTPAAEQPEAVTDD
ncbi:hypothetical protein BABINDRAFT_160172 [Babjeviella inositovora NRRL Y-12698]|uniref:General transcription and DNA repair factor IIH subunit TFB4 n=1 Tax=Babjeviella inositovora NRRL Y-12698 TaxID=984486 RepID=A0A1E3QWS5_9ASCO|nr:uncharacterized protein BABINDRAFT_160172 [Babjeviella inositovora NRRL Y-12698]ODQ81954.1 hypothetical protein BABINDRAFT_160172 [Babjeviella inositovora NRRL Y-12698]